MAGPFEGDNVGDKNRIHRITFLIGPTKTAAHVVHPTGSKKRYDSVRDDSQDPQNIHYTPRDRYITEED